MSNTLTKLWRVEVYAERAHTNPSWATNVRAVDKQSAIICAMTIHDGLIGRVECHRFDGHGEVSPEWTGE